MKHLAIGLCATVLSGGLLASCAPVKDSKPAAAQTPSPYGLPHVKRPNLIVADLDRSLAIYSDILGFSKAEIRDSALDSFAYPVFNFPKEARMRFTYLGEPDEMRVLGLTEVRGIDIPRPPSEPYMSAMVFAITDLEGKFAQLEALGLKVSPSKIAGNDEFRFIEQAFVDPDGHLITCYEILGE